MNLALPSTSSCYMRADAKNIPVRRWAARALLSADLESCFAWNKMDRSILPLFNRYDLDPSNDLDNWEVITSWLNRQLDDCNDPSFDSSDPFYINTARIAQDLKLSDIELSILRFAMLKCQLQGFKKSLQVIEGEFNLVDACYLLAHIMELPPVAVQQALREDAPLRQTGLIPMPSHYRRGCDLDDWTLVPYTLLNLVFDAYPHGFSIEEKLFGKAPKPLLKKRDFSHLGDSLDTLADYLKNACRHRIKGANILLQGPPGTGKTELARWLANSTRHSAIEIAPINAQGQSIAPNERLETWQLCQGITPPGRKRVIVFDEVEEILSDVGFATHGFRRSTQFSKGFLNTLLETNVLPTIWITNTLSGIDDAYLRRFDMTLHVSAPDERARRRIAKRAFRDLPAESGFIDMIAAQKRLTPAHVEKASRVCQIVGAESASKVETVARQVLDQDLRSMHSKPMSAPEVRKQAPSLAVDSSVLNTSVSPDTLLTSLTNSGFGRLCFYGPPGTGKTAFAANIAERLGRPLIVRQVSDILGPYVGMTEQNIASAFEEASRAGAVLLLDEADSFLQNRKNAEKHWQVTEVNQFLTSLERYEGYLVCTTNLVEGLDPAALRRFDFKVEFGTMNDAQARRMVAMVLQGLGKKRMKIAESELVRLSGTKLVPGDFAVALRQGSMNPGGVSVKAVIDTVLGEARMREPAGPRSIGFL